MDISFFLHFFEFVVTFSELMIFCIVALNNGLDVLCTGILDFKSVSVSC